ncbi:hypothetical protein AXL1_55 [Stenotrophomonas phage vB_SmaS-AXL_1]|uniref:hypothetical protein n=1 Tax=Stenotrophomonas phage vB_SmaS-AXL_1 TaxID=2909581 RepID=UPI0024096AE6|nr:hypothetical protein P9A52_gp55 [Stenotrophomonas phage vB_SmaS-AXL_1]UIS24784.1 hypothetical protein AXL1_55 [Stenotrophomonas phage vB_SmaS-AXL_1]
MSSARDMDALDLLADLLGGNVCAHEIQLQRVTALLGAVAARSPDGSLTVSMSEIISMSGRFIGIEQDPDTLEIRVTAGERPAEQPQPTHPAPTTRQ